MDKLLAEIRSCRHCEKHLEYGPNPIIAAHATSKLVVIGQAPGSIVHETGIPWNDKSGDTLRKWMGVEASTFYNPRQIALIPMGFCYPGKGKSGDLPPRPECAPLWHKKLLEQLREVKLILLIGQYAQHYYLQNKTAGTLTNTVKQYQTYLPTYFPLPHPSPRNNSWQAKNQWFSAEVIPQLQLKIKDLL